MSDGNPQVFRYLKKAAKRIIPLGLALYFIPIPTAIFFAFGLVDVTRNQPLSLFLFDKYFFGNGVLTWLISPFNLLIDVISLPFRNKGIYGIDDFPEKYASEINFIIETLKSKPEVLTQMAEYAKTEDRAMIFFKWYGKKLPSPIEIPEFENEFDYIRTIGISAFNAHRSTALHFGPFRSTIRVLYNLNRIESDDVFIEVGDHRQKWRDNQLFIFDDTLLHRSVNESDELRYCLFADVLRPSHVPGVLRIVVAVTQFVFLRVNYMFYKNWKFIR